MSTGLLVLGTLVAWFAVEIWRLVHKQGSISQDIQGLARIWPFIGDIVCLVIGGLLVHFFWLT